MRIFVLTKLIGSFVFAKFLLSALISLISSCTTILHVVFHTLNGFGDDCCYNVYLVIGFFPVLLFVFSGLQSLNKCCICFPCFTFTFALWTVFWYVLYTIICVFVYMFFGFLFLHICNSLMTLFFTILFYIVSFIFVVKILTLHFLLFCRYFSVTLTRVFGLSTT